MDENNLQINITAVDEASGTLENVAASAENMATSIDEAASSISTALTSALTSAEEAAVDAALATANAWMGAAEEIDGALATVSEASSGDFDAIASASAAAAESTVISWEESQAALTKIMGENEAEAAAGWATMGVEAEASAAKATGAMTSMHGYFRMLIAGYLADTAGKGLLGVVSDAVTAAAGDPTQLVNLQNQLKQQQAALAKLELPISGKGKTTDTLHADEAQQSAQIAAATEKIKELKAQIDPLAEAQSRAGQSAKDYAAATAQLTKDENTFMITAGVPLLELLANGAIALDHIVLSVTAWAEKHPKLTEALLIGTAILGGLLLVIGGLLIAIAPIIILFGMFEIAITVASVAWAGLIVALVVGAAFLVGALVANWSKIKQDVSAAWDAIVNFIKDHWQAILQILMPGIGTLVVFLFNNWTLIKNDVMDAWNWIANFITGIWGKIVSGAEAAIGSVRNLIQSIMAPINSLTGAVSSIGSAIGSGASSLLNMVPHFADGGIVNGPTIGLIGEAGPEAIIPLSAFKGGMGLAGAGAGAGGGNIIVNLSGNFYGSDASMMNKLSRGLGKMINEQIKLRTH